LRIIWEPRARRDIEHLRLYISKDKPEAAKRTALHVMEACKVLLTHPGAGRPGQVFDTRELIVAGTPFIVAYRVQGTDIRILAVMHGAQAWPEKFPSN
jgi:toxin ParE1/3/4